MSDLERVREALFDPSVLEGALQDLNAHLKEDAERDANAEEWRQTADDVEAELARLREEAEATLAVAEKYHAELARRQSIHEDEIARLRETQDELRLLLAERTAENARLREENKQLLLTKAGAFKAQMEYQARYTELLEAVEALFDAAHPGLVDARFPEQAARLRQLIEEADRD